MPAMASATTTWAPGITWPSAMKPAISAEPSQIATGASTMPAQNQATRETQKIARVTGKSRIDQPPTATKPAPGSQNPSPAAMHSAGALASTGTKPRITMAA
jgi:hypothetical protein